MSSETPGVGKYNVNLPINEKGGYLNREPTIGLDGWNKIKDTPHSNH